MNQTPDPLASLAVAEKMFTVNLTDEQLSRFWNKIRFIGASDDECWNWIGARQKQGYGNIALKSKPKTLYIRAHRLAYFLHFGPFLDEMKVLHKCDNPSCVNPNHLWLGTTKDNNNDCLRKGRHGPSSNPSCMRRGEDASFSKIKETDVRFIRDHPPFLYGERKALADRLGVTTALIEAVRKRRIWKHVT